MKRAQWGEIAVGLVTGLLLGLGAGLVREALDDRISSQLSSANDLIESLERELELRCGVPPGPARLVQVRP